jgi:uncharacterized membrane-anchored protein
VAVVNSGRTSLALLHNRATAVVVVGLLTALVVGTLALPAEALAGRQAAADGTLEVSTLQFEPANDAGSAFWMWVNVTNGGTEPVENVTASISGVQVLTPPGTTANSNPSLGRGASRSAQFDVAPGGSIAVTATITSRAPLARVRVVVSAPGGTTFTGTAGHSSSVSVAPSDVETAGAGNWTATVTQVAGVTAVTCSLAISVSYAAATPTERVDNISGGDAHSFRWMVQAGSAGDPPATAVVVVTATVPSAGGASQDLTYTAALGKPVVSGTGPAEGGSAAAVDFTEVLVVVVVWALVPLAWLGRFRGVGPLSPGSRLSGVVRGRTGRILEAPAPASVGAQMLRKVPEITLYFWIIKVLCTTVGETAADQLNGTSLAGPMALGLSGTNLLMMGLLVLALIFQFTYRSYVPTIYWIAVVLISVVGTLITDHLHDDLGMSLDALTVFFAVALAIVFAIWYSKERTLSIHSIYTRRREAFYWAAILATFALGTASGDLGLERLTAALGQVPSADDPTVMVALHPQAALMISAGIFGAVIGFCYMGWRYLKLNAVLMFWVAYIFTRPLGANIGDILTLTPEDGGMGLDKLAVNLVFFAAIVASVYYLTVTRKDVFEGDAQSPAEVTAQPVGAWVAAPPEE